MLLEMGHLTVSGHGAPGLAPETADASLGAP